MAENGPTPEPNPPAVPITTETRSRRGRASATGATALPAGRRVEAVPAATARVASLRARACRRRDPIRSGHGTSRAPGRGGRYRWYHTSVQKTTLYLPEELKAAVKRTAAERGVSEAEIIRDSIRASVGGVRPRPRGGLYSSGRPIARDAEEILAGFGER